MHLADACPTTHPWNRQARRAVEIHLLPFNKWFVSAEFALTLMLSSAST
jgi:hypothetical protein